jgi:hypothetical protein
VTTGGKPASEYSFEGRRERDDVVVVLSEITSRWLGTAGELVHDDAEHHRTNE